MRTPAPPLLAIFRSHLQGELLCRVLLQPGDLTITALARELGEPVATVHREVARLETAGLLTTRRVGRARLVSPDDTNPAVGPLRELVMITFGPQRVVAEELAGLPGVRRALIFGSWAARHAGQAGPPPGDIDVLLVGDVPRSLAYEAADRAQARLNRQVNPIVASQARWEDPADPLMAQVRSRPHLEVTGGP